MARSLHSSIETLEARIAPAGLAVFHPLIDLMPGLGKTGATIDLGASLDSDTTAGYRTHVEFLTNFDTDPSKPGLQAGKIVIELFDEKAPLTVANFLSYVNNANARGDLDGVFFHRLASGFVLQTGGYEASNPGAHIPVGQAVHNEFNPNDPERANVAGTVAMAKVGGDPNSATSEFFFNLADNRSNLDNQNGGFTVFAKVVEGMDVINAIASMPTVTVNSFPVPYQNGYSPSSGVAPKGNQVVAFTSVDVVPPKNSTIAHAQYSVESVLDQDGNPSHILTTNASATTGLLVGDTLKLAYKPGASGIATVKIKITDTSDPGADPIYETFQVNLQPNLVVKANGDTLPLVSVSGDSGVGSVKLVNTGVAAAVGTVDVHFYLSHVDGFNTDSSGNQTPAGPDPNGTIIDLSDLEVGSLTGALINIGSGKTGTLNANLHIPDGIDMASGQYRLIAKVTSSDGSSIIESYTDDNVSIDGRIHGFFPGEAKANLTVLGTNDNLPTLIMPGDHGIAKVGIGNSASATAAGDVLVQLYLSYDNNPGSGADGLDSSDVLIGQLVQPLTLAGGKSITLDVPIMVPRTLNSSEGFFHIFAVVGSPTNGAIIDELTGSDNAAAGPYHVEQHRFGTFSVDASSAGLGVLVRKNAPLIYEDGNGNPITVKLTGAGNGSFSITANGGIQLSVENTNLLSSLSVTAANGTTPLFENVYTGALSSAAIGAINLGNAAWTGSVIAYGGARSITLGNTSGDTDHFLGLGTSKAVARIQPVIKLGDVQDLSLTSNQTIANLTANKWLDVNENTETVNSLGLVNFKVAGNFEADMRIEADNPAATPAMRTFVVDGVLKDSEVRISGNVGTVRLAGMENTNFLVAADVLPSVPQDFNLTRSIASFTITGGGDHTMIDSNVAASRFGSILVSAQVNPTSDHIFGFIADKIASYKRGGAAALRGLDAPKDVDTSGAYRVELV